MGSLEHWDRVYTSTPTDRLGWFEPHLRTSLNWIRRLHLSPDAPIIDVGGGVSTLADDLLEAGQRDVTVLDLSEKALALAKARLGERALSVTWLSADVLQAALPPSRFALWHDRAVFHFLTEAPQREAYRSRLLAALQPDGHVIMATFASEAPPKCSGLPVERYSPERLQEAMGSTVQLQRHEKELHVTPAGVEQPYLYCLFRRQPE